MKKFLSFIFFIMLLSQAVASEKIVLTTLDWEPYIGKSMDDNGYVGEVVREAFKRGGYEVVFKFFPWARTVKLATEGKVDGYFPEYFSEELSKHSVVSDPFDGGPVGFFKRKGYELEYKTLQDLKSLKIGVVRGYVNEKNFDAATFLKKEEVTTDLLNIKKLLKNRIDLFVADKFVGFYTLKKEMPNMLGQIEFVDPALALNNLYVCISKKAKDYDKKITAFNKGLKSLKADGTFDKILKKHGF